MIHGSRAASALMVVGLGCGLISGCSAGYTDGARPGVAQPGGGGELDSPAHTALVRLPLGPLTLQVGRPTRTVDDIDAPNRRAADGAIWVPVAWTLAGGGADYSNNTPAYQFQVTLVAAGRRYGLQAGQPGDSDQAASLYMPVVKQKSVDVAVQGDGKHLEVEVEYDGVTQTVDVDSGRIASGVAAPLYAKNAPHTALPTTLCPLMTSADAARFRATGTTCTLGVVQTTPYVGGLGWVGSARQTWVLVPLDLSLLEFDDRRTTGRYSNFDVRTIRVTVDGIAPTTEILRYRSGDRLELFHSGVLVFRTSAHPTSVHVTVVVRGENEYRDGQFHTFTGDHTYSLG